MSVGASKVMEYLKDHMKKTIDHMKSDFSGFRTGKASPALVENITVEYYGTPTRLKELAGITAPEPRLLVIQPWDASAAVAIEKAIKASNIGINPINDGRILRLPIPELSEERRASLAKQVKARAEDARVAVRNLRREGNETVKKAQKGGEITEDDLKKMTDDIQKMTDQSIKDIDASLKAKEDELMSM